MTVLTSNPLRWGLFACIAAFEGSMLWAIASPRVSEDYRAFFIERSSRCWPAAVSGDLALGEKIWFLKADVRGPAAKLRRCGWVTTGSGAWSEGPEARLLLRSPQTGEALTVTLDMRPYLPPGITGQRVFLAANGTAIADLQLDTQSGNTHGVTIPASLVPDDGLIELSMRFPDAISTQEQGTGEDSRQWAVRLISLIASQPESSSAAPG